jgi:hypothetical protein
MIITAGTFVTVFTTLMSTIAAISTPIALVMVAKVNKKVDGLLTSKDDRNDRQEAEYIRQTQQLHQVIGAQTEQDKHTIIIKAVPADTIEVVPPLATVIDSTKGAIKDV